MHNPSMPARVSSMKLIWCLEICETIRLKPMLMTTMPTSNCNRKVRLPSSDSIPGFDKPLPFRIGPLSLIEAQLRFALIRPGAQYLVDSEANKGHTEAERQAVTHAGTI